jgi:hypothetical protein
LFTVYCSYSTTPLLLLLPLLLQYCHCRY